MRGLGSGLFWLYCFLYAGFIGLALLAPGVLALRIGPANVAILYGFGLILWAIVSALLYVRWGEEA